MKPAFVVGILVAVTLLAVLPGKAAASPATPSGLVPGDIYVTDDSANAVFRIDPTTGTQTLVTSGGALGFPLGIAIGPDGNLWVASGNWVPTSTSEAAVVRVDPDTGTQTVVSTDDQFEFPSGIAFAPDGDLYVTDQGSAATGVTTADGSLFRVDPVSGAQALISHGDLLIDPVDLAFAPDGSLFVVDWGGGTDGAVIQVDVTTGDQTLVSSGGYFVNPTGLAIASDGSILVADQIVRSSTNDGKIIMVDPEDGTQTVAYSSDKLYDPSDLAFEDGTIVVADFNKRVVRIDVDSGTQTIRLYGSTSATRPTPSVRSSDGTPDPVWTIWSCQTLEKPSTTRPMPSVMISGWTRNKPTPTPLSRPAIPATIRATRIAMGTPNGPTSVAVTKPAIDAT